MKRKKKLKIYLMAVIPVAIIASLFLLYISEDTLFPDKLGDMELKLHREGDVAIREIKGSHEAKDNVNPEEAHVVRYRNSAGIRSPVSIIFPDNENFSISNSNSRMHLIAFLVVINPDVAP